MKTAVKMGKRKKLIVVGGGFAGSYVARNLEHEFDVTLIDLKNYFEFTPGILRTIIKPQHIRKIQSLHTRYLRHSKIILGEVKDISKGSLKVNNQILRFDYLVICSGSNYSPPIKEQNIVVTSRADTLKDCSGKLSASEEVIIIGGGLVGVELAGEIVSHYPKKRLKIIHAGKSLMPRNNSRSATYAEKFLTKRGVEIVYNKEMKDTKRESKNKIIFLCTGITPNINFMEKNFAGNLEDGKWIKSNDFLQMEGVSHIFIAGDVSNMKEEKTAQNSREQAKIAVKNILAIEAGKEMTKYVAKKRPMVISLGKFKGIFEYKNFVFCGIIPAVLKTLIEKGVMFEYR